MKKISNPLTIIGIFAGIAEVAGTVVLPFVSDKMQTIFIWYVMLFPVILVIAFFLTLNFNSTVLYSPSDFTDERNYMESMRTLKRIKSTVESASESGKNDQEIIHQVYNEVKDQLDVIEINSVMNRNKLNSVVQLLTEYKDGLSTNKIASILGLSLASTSQIIKQLIEKGLVSGEKGPLVTITYKLSGNKGKYL